MSLRVPVGKRGLVPRQALPVLMCATLAACATHRPLCEGPLRPINLGAAAAQVAPVVRHGP
jgi:hypothetical protein